HRSLLQDTLWGYRGGMTSSPDTKPSATPESTSVVLDIGGMTCSSCVARVESKLNRIDGVRASVNLATEQASVRYDPTLVSADDLIAAVRSTGYSAQLPA